MYKNHEHEGLVISQIKTEFDACSLETAPENDRNEALAIVIGCYQLDQNKCADGSNPQTRSGQLRTYTIANNSLEFGDAHVTNLHQGGGVLDCKWLPKRNLLASALSSGEIAFHVLETTLNDGKFRLTRIQVEQELAHESNTICLALDWSIQGGEYHLVSSYSNGQVVIHQIDWTEETLELKMQEIHRWKAHTLFGKTPSEVWTCCWAKYHPIVLSGGNDGTMKGWDLRSCLSRPIFQVGDCEYQAGVTALSWQVSNHNTFASGSYDEGVRLWDIRTLSSNGREPLARMSSCGGGIWRLKWHPQHQDKLLVAAMHGGCCVLTLEDNSFRKISALTNMHQSMAYGADWLGNSEHAASCSFYDQLACIWKAL